MPTLRSRSGLAVASTLLSLALLEAICRVVFPLPEIENLNRIEFTPTALFGGTQQGNRESPPPLRNVRLQWISDPDGFVFTHTLNLYGFRTPDFRIAKAPGTTRVAIVGDSFAEGFGADDDHTIARVFERAAGDGVEVINLGVAATGLPEYLELANVAQSLLGADLVVIVTFQNDFPPPFFDDEKKLEPRSPVWTNPWQSRFLRVWREKAAGLPVASIVYGEPRPFFLPVPDPSNPLVFNPNPAGIPQPIRRAMEQGRFNPFANGVPRGVENTVPVDLGSRPATRSYLEAYRDLAERYGSKLLLAFLPLHVTVSDYYYPFWNQLGEPFREPTLTGPKYRRHAPYLAKVAGELGVAFLDLTAPIEAHERRGEHLFHGYDEHMTNRGYTVVGQELLEFARAEELLP